MIFEYLLYSSKEKNNKFNNFINKIIDFNQIHTREYFYSTGKKYVRSMENRNIKLCLLRELTGTTDINRNRIRRVNRLIRTK